jgi:hypothetical protein
MFLNKNGRFLEDHRLYKFAIGSFSVDQNLRKLQAPREIFSKIRDDLPLLTLPAIWGEILADKIKTARIIGRRNVSGQKIMQQRVIRKSCMGRE